MARVLPGEVRIPQPVYLESLSVRHALSKLQFYCYFILLSLIQSLCGWVVMLSHATDLGVRWDIRQSPSVKIE